MVWNTTQSALYQAIDAFNNGEKNGENQSESCNKNEGSELSQKAPLKSSENSVNNEDNSAGCCCPKCPACQKNNPAGLSRLFSDSDMLLIAGLILILSRQNADRKLILALAFVLLT